VVAQHIQCSCKKARACRRLSSPDKRGREPARKTPTRKSTRTAARKSTRTARKSTRTAARKKPPASRREPPANRREPPAESRPQIDANRPQKAARRSTRTARRKPPAGRREPPAARREPGRLRRTPLVAGSKSHGGVGRAAWARRGAPPACHTAPGGGQAAALAVPCARPGAPVPCAVCQIPGEPHSVLTAASIRDALQVESNLFYTASTPHGASMNKIFTGKQTPSSRPVSRAHRLCVMSMMSIISCLRAPEMHLANTRILSP